MTTQITEQLRERISRLPLAPGVYLFKNASGEIIYIGKAARLRNRVRSYFAKRGQWAWTEVMARQITDFEYITTDSEREALTLETHLIKEHRPRFNILMRDDKSYLYLKITVKDEFPRVTTTRKLVSDGARYFGPFPSGEAGVRQVLRYLRLVFPFRTALERPEKMLQQPALDYYVKHYGGSYGAGLDPAVYRRIIDRLISFLDGKYEAVLRDLRRRMEEAAQAEQFELAARLRDQVSVIERLGAEQKVAQTNLTDQDVVGIHREPGRAAVNLFHVREGRVVRRERFLLELAPEQEAAEALGQFLTQYYSQAGEVPREVLLSEAPADLEESREDLCRLAGRKVQVNVPSRGFKKKLAALATKNAAEYLAAEEAKFLADRARLDSAGTELARALGLPGPPRRIECYDNSNLQGSDATSSMVVFEEGKPKKGQYRRFKVKTVEGIDDYATMREILTRRFGRLPSVIPSEVEGTGRSMQHQHRDSSTRLPEKPAQNDKKDESFQARPDLILIDGGKGQLRAAKRVLDELNLDVPVIGLAKREEEVFQVSGKGFKRILLPYRSEGLYLLQRIRDEAHRFAVSYHTHLRARSVRGSALDTIPGVGPATRKKLLKTFGSLQGVRAASEAELAAAIGPAKAKQVKQAL
jgi:excinuclease ABC subunit C